jgi:hypothetical protein
VVEGDDDLRGWVRHGVTLEALERSS